MFKRRRSRLHVDFKKESEPAPAKALTEVTAFHELHERFNPRLVGFGISGPAVSKLDREREPREWDDAASPKGTAESDGPK